ncbi:MAG TPA: hypothetical protein VHG51_16380 [Longimicrobiaceae bacterium]|nr:hypothetical protein [Longimicrobiaceae bacterium]
MSRSRTILDNARDELFSHIQRCGVLRATPEQQAEWLDDTMGYLAETFPALTQGELDELRGMGDRFCQPAIPHGKGYTDLSRESWEQEAAEEEELAPA